MPMELESRSGFEDGHSGHHGDISGSDNNGVMPMSDDVMTVTESGVENNVGFNAVTAVDAEGFDEDFAAAYPDLTHITPSFPFLHLVFYECQAASFRATWSSKPVIKPHYTDLTSDNALLVGRQLVACVRESQTAEGAVYVWTLRNPSMGALVQDYPDLHKSFVQLAQAKLSRSMWILSIRVIRMAGVSMIDLASDIYMIILYYSSPGLEHFGRNLLTMVSVTLLLQAAIVIVQNKSVPKKMILELFFVFSGTKVAVDAYRVTTGKRQERYNIIDPKSEFVGTKTCELACESIPGCITQIYAALSVLQNGGTVTTIPMLSILFSAVTAGLASKNISFDFDVDPKQRKRNPSFYGYIPSDAFSRSVISTCLITISAILLLTTSLTYSLLLLVNKSYVFWYVVANYSLYFLQKLARRDYHYWMPIEGNVGVVVSFLMRFLVKLVADFTAVIQYRHPGELGGIYFSLNLIASFLSTYAAVYIYYENSQGTEEAVAIEEMTAWTLTGILSGIFVISFSTYLWFMESKYRESFWNTDTIRHKTMSLFLDSQDDATKSVILKHNKNQWVEIRDEVKEFVLANYERWKVEKPKWFNDAWISRLDEDMIPNTQDKGEIQIIRRRNSARRRSSFGLVAHQIVPLEEEKVDES